MITINCPCEFGWHLLEEAQFREEVRILSREGRRTTNPIKVQKENGRGDVEDLGGAVLTALNTWKVPRGPETI